MGKEAILKVLRNNPNKFFSQKELSKLTKVNIPAVNTIIRKLMKEKEFYRIKTIQGKNESNNLITLYASY